MECNIYKKVKKIGISNKQIQKAIYLVLQETKKTKGVLSVHLIADKRMRSLSNKYRNIDKSTDVLSFAAQEGNYILAEEDLGDIFLSVPFIKRQAKCMDKSFREEFFRVLIHGVLHLLGYNHEKEKDASQMFSFQENLLKRFL